LDHIHVARPFVWPLFSWKLGFDNACRRPDFIDKSYPFFLAVGAYTPTKNIVSVLQAFKEYQAIHPAEKIVLVVVGRRGWDDAAERLAAQIADVWRVESVTDEELRYLYAHCSQFISASLVEGFGLPVLEAAAMGCPIVCSDIPAHVEILGNRGNYFDPRDVSDIVFHMRTDRRGPVDYSERLTEFTAERMGRQLLAAYRAAMTL
jgi:glycosyltransferase involved in cell wall biosynthesis